MILSLLLGAKFPVPGSFVVWDSTTMQARLSPAHIDSILTSVSKIKQGQSLTVKKIETGRSDGSCVQWDTFWPAAGLSRQGKETK